jgi:hypothetical protein
MLHDIKINTNEEHTKTPEEQIMYIITAHLSKSLPDELKPDFLVLLIKRIRICKLQANQSASRD